MKSACPTIYVVDDSEEQLNLVSRQLAAAGYSILTHSCGNEFLARHDISELGCVLLDNQMPGLSGLDVQQELINRKVDIPVVFMSGASPYSDVVGALRNGALGFLQKPFTRGELIEEVEKAISESESRLNARAINSKNMQKLQSLTSREAQVFELIVAGHTNKAISELLFITTGTIEYHRANLLKKLEVSTLPELMAIWRQTHN